MDRESGLALPQESVVHRHEELSATPFVAVTLGFREMFGSTVAWNDLAARLGKYKREAILGFIGQMSLILDRSRRERTETTQTSLASAIWGDESTRVLDAYGRASRVHGGTHALFHEAQLLTLAKAAFLLPEGDMPTVERFADLGEALLIVTDLIDEDSGALTGWDPDTEVGGRNWQQYLAANSLFDPSDDMVAELVRSQDLYLTDKSRLHAHPDYVNLPEAVTRATGLTPEVLTIGLFGIAARWIALSDEQILSGDVLIRPSTHFQSSFAFSDEEVERFFGLVSDSVAHLESEVRRGYGARTLHAFDPMPFAKAPIARFEDFGVLVSAPLLRSRLGGGLQHLFLAGAFEHDERERYLRYRGAVFEDYVHRLFERQFGGHGARYVDGATLRAAARGKVCDGAVAYGPQVLLFEVKASSFPLSVRRGRAWGEYLRCVTDVLVDGALQIHSTVGAIARGELRSCGLDPAAVRFAVPLIVTLERLPHNPLLSALVRNELRRREAPADAIHFLPQVMHIGELEVAEKAMERGRSLLELVQDKAADERSGMHSFYNWWHAKSERFLDSSRSVYVGEQYRQLWAEMKRTSAARKRDDVRRVPPG